MHKHAFLIIGAGPCGLGAAYRLKELGITDWALFEKEGYVGGLATSFQDAKSFWWDIGGHVQFSHYHYFDELMDTLLGNNWVYHDRESWVWIANRFVPYPFQLNIHRLPQVLRDECLDGLKKLSKQKLKSKSQNFADWIYQTSGAGIAKYFLLPYNFKVWAYQPKELNVSWVGERVARPDIKRIEKNITSGHDDVSWGPNNQFRFPLYGGTGAIWQALGAELPQKQLYLNHQVTHINTSKHEIAFSNQVTISYDHLISTIPLDQLVVNSDVSQKLKAATKQLLHSTTHIVGIGLKSTPKPELKTKCWLYFPESNCPFYRVTVFSNYSPNNAPAGHWSLMAEVSESTQKQVNKNNLLTEVLQGLKNTQLISEANEIVSTWQYKTAYGYPTPSLNRDAALAIIQPELMKRNVYSRGRFGMWKYEVSNQDHSLMQGKEVIDLLVNNEPEVTAWQRR
ncbi:MAG: Amine oxidase [Candidatus Gottesmanbacteria bacterium GW2011_GWA1_43_11]|uniref:Amine oxidase n=1 Tax=Candidatus Gottesmanbacteria bacterium GW2011_GWA1_43_11 TaxID=1618436 RepID=A0A0G1CHJ0_9BACT|nr:MAG: Amine oxidase [Candidatus Gottesmanbacteria bacterium GW2011_GWA1_43_11]